MEVTDGSAFAAYMKSVRRRTLEVAKAVPPERETFRLSEDGMSPVDILVHIAVVEDSLWGSGLKSGRAVPLDEPSRDGMSLATAVDFMTDKRKDAAAFWRALTPDDLEREIITPTGHKHVLKRWLVLAPEHEIHHRTFIHAYRKFWGLGPHPIYGLTLPELREKLDKLEGEAGS